MVCEGRYAEWPSGHTRSAVDGRIGRKLKICVSVLVLVCLQTMPGTTADAATSGVYSAASNTRGHCGGFSPMAGDDRPETTESGDYVYYSSSPQGTTVRRNGFGDDVKTLKRIRTRLRAARNHFRNHRRTIAWLYSDVNTVMRTGYRYEWLPGEPLAWYEKHVKNLHRDARTSVLLPVLRDSLHNFSSTLDQMRRFSGTRCIASDYTARKLVLDALCEYLIAALCEVETAVVDLRRRWPQGMAGDRTTVGGVLGPGWDADPDRTTMLIQDWGVLTVYYRFLKEWLHISQQMVRDRMASP